MSAHWREAAALSANTSHWWVVMCLNTIVRRGPTQYWIEFALGRFEEDAGPFPTLDAAKAAYLLLL